LGAGSLFFAPNNPLLAPKKPLFNGYFPLSGLFFMALQGFICTISVDIYAFRFAFSRILHCV